MKVVSLVVVLLVVVLVFVVLGVGGSVFVVGEVVGRAVVSSPSCPWITLSCSCWAARAFCWSSMSSVMLLSFCSCSVLECARVVVLKRLSLLVKCWSTSSVRTPIMPWTRCLISCLGSEMIFPKFWLGVRAWGEDVR